MSETEPRGVDERFEVTIKVPKRFYVALEQLAATGMYSALEPCTDCAESVGECAHCAGKEECFVSGPDITAAELLRGALTKMVESGAFLRLVDFDPETRTNPFKESRCRSGSTS